MRFIRVSLDSGVISWTPAESRARLDWESQAAEFFVDNFRHSREFVPRRAFSVDTEDEPQNAQGFLVDTFGGSPSFF